MEEKEKRSPLLRELLYIPNLQSPMKTGKKEANQRLLVWPRRKRSVLGRGEP